MEVKGLSSALRAAAGPRSVFASGVTWTLLVAPTYTALDLATSHTVGAWLRRVWEGSARHADAVLAWEAAVELARLAPTMPCKGWSRVCGPAAATVLSLRRVG